MQSVGYPMGDPTANIMKPRDVQKWIELTHQIYQRHNKTGESLDQLVETATSDWDTMERYDYKNWLRYYQSGAASDYPKLAQVLPNSFMVNPAPQNGLLQVQDKEQTVKDLKALIGRLNSAERIATKPSVVKKLKEYGVSVVEWLAALHDLKRQIQLTGIRSEASAIELIYRKAEQLESLGRIGMASELKKLAQTVEAPLPGMTAPPVDPNMAGGLPQPTTEEAPLPLPHEEAKDPIDEFIENLNGKKDEAESDDLETEADYLDSFMAFGQISPDQIASPSQVRPEPPPVIDAPDAPLEMLEPEAPELIEGGTPIEIDGPDEEAIETEEPIADPVNDDSILEAAFQGITVEDVIGRLEKIVNLFRQREVSHQLAFIDLMLGHLNLQSFFPGLGEASSKNLEANQYILTRLEDVLGKLRGSATSSKLNLVQEEMAQDPQIESIKQTLSDQDNLEKLRKDKRKKEDLDKVLLEESPTVEQAQEELASTPVMPKAEVPEAQPKLPAPRPVI